MVVSLFAIYFWQPLEKSLAYKGFACLSTLHHLMNFCFVCFVWFVWLSEYPKNSIDAQIWCTIHSVGYYSILITSQLWQSRTKNPEIGNWIHCCSVKAEPCNFTQPLINFSNQNDVIDPCLVISCSGDCCLLYWTPWIKLMCYSLHDLNWFTVPWAKFASWLHTTWGSKLAVISSTTYP